MQKLTTQTLALFTKVIKMPS